MVLFLAGCAAYYVKVNVGDRLGGITDSPSDFQHYYRAAGYVLRSQSPYADAGLDYPPAVAFLFAPLALTDYVTARRIWFWSSQAFLLLAAVLAWRALGRDGTAACSVACVWALGGAAWESLALGQLSPLLVLLLVLAYWRAAAGQGAALGAGFSLKFIPGVVAMVPLLRRDGRAAAVLAAVTIALVLAPSAVISHWKSGPAAPVHADYWMGTPAVLNWSLPAVALRVADPPVSPTRLPRNWEFGNTTEGLHLPRGQRWLSAGVAAGVLLGGLAALVAVSRGRLSEAQAPWAAAALISLGVAASPISWNHYQMLQYPGLALLLCHAVRRRRWLLGGCTVALGALLYQVPREVLRAYYAQHAGWSAASPATLYTWTSVTPIAALLLFGVLLRQLSEGASPPHRPGGEA